MSNLTTLRPYPSSFPKLSFPPPPSVMTGSFEMIPPSSPLASPTSFWRENRNEYEVPWIASTPSHIARNSNISPSPSVVSLSTMPLATTRQSEPETKRRRIAIESLTHPSSPPSNHWDSDILASSALQSLSLDPRPFNFVSSSSSTSDSSLLSSPSSSPPTSPTSLSSSSSSYTRESESLFSGFTNEPHSPTSTSPPLSPRKAQAAVEIMRHKGKQLKSRCTCCHVCRTSLKNYPRNHLDCSACNAVVCQNCIEFRLTDGPSWEEASKQLKWLCPSCLGTCICQRCNTRPIEFVKTPSKNNNNKSKRNSKDQSSEVNEIDQHMAALKQNFLEREKFIQEIHNLLCVMKKEQRSIENQITALQQSAEAKAQQSSQ